MALVTSDSSVMSPELKTLKGLKVLHLIDSGGLYGAEKMLLALVKEQLRQGLNPMILSAGVPGMGEKALENEAHRLGLPIKSWRMKPGLNLREARVISSWSDRQGFNLMHSHGYKFNILMGFLPILIRKMPFVVTKHGYVHARPLSKTKLYQLLDRFATARANHTVLVGSKMLPESFRKGQNVSRTTVIQNGVDLESIRSDSMSSLGSDDVKILNDHHPVLVGVGRLALEKGFENAIRAIPLIRAKQKHVALVLIGEGPLRDALVSLAKELRVDDCVYFLGYRTEVAAWLRSADMLLMPSLTEGLPITLLESMSLRTPVIATRVGDIPSVLGEGQGGRLIKSSKALDLANEVEWVCRGGSEIDRMIEWSLRRVTYDFSLSRMEQDYRRVYAEVLT